jgi:hypothetical protein
LLSLTADRRIMSIEVPACRLPAMKETSAGIDVWSIPTYLDKVIGSCCGATEMHFRTCTRPTQWHCWTWVQVVKEGCLPGWGNPVARKVSLQLWKTPVGRKWLKQQCAGGDVSEKPKMV